METNLKLERGSLFYEVPMEKRPRSSFFKEYWPLSVIMLWRRDHRLHNVMTPHLSLLHTVPHTCIQMTLGKNCFPSIVHRYLKRPIWDTKNHYRRINVPASGAVVPHAKILTVTENHYRRINLLFLMQFTTATTTAAEAAAATSCVQTITFAEVDSQ